MPPTRDEGEKRRGKMGGMSRYGVLWVLYKIFDDINLKVEQEVDFGRL